MGCDLGDMAVTCRRIFGRIGAQYSGFGRWNRDLDHRSEPSGENVSRRSAIIGPICEEQINRTVDLIQEIWKCCWVPNIFGGQIGADDLATDKIETEVQLAPSAPFAFGFMLLLKPFALAEDLQTCE